MCSSCSFSGVAFVGNPEARSVAEPDWERLEGCIWCVWGGVHIDGAECVSQQDASCFTFS